MALKDILLHFECRPQDAPRLELAVALARRHGARLTGLYVTEHGNEAPATTRKKVQGAAEAFTAATADVPTRWRSLPAAGLGSEGAARVLIGQTHGSDLLVLGQSGPVRRGPGLPERVVLAGGRPVLVVPHSGSFAGAGNRVLVAWSAGRGACRALHDALPLLQQARQVTLLKLTGSGEEAPGEADICDHLAQHGIEAVLERRPLIDGIGDQLLNLVYDEGYDLLVMGVGSASGLGAPGIGPVAAQILRQMTVPVLLAY